MKRFKKVTGKGIQIMAVKVDIFGSCVCRDIFRYVDSEKYQVNRCLSNIPITSLYEGAVQVSKDFLENVKLTQYEKKMLRILLRRNSIQLLENSEANVLIMDLANEFMQRWDVAIGEKTISLAVPEEREAEYEEFFGRQSFAIVKKISMLEMDMEYVEECLKQFAESIVKSPENPNGYEEKNIIVIESLYTPDILGNDGNIHGHDKKYKLHEYNEWLRKAYMILYKYIQECKVIKLPDFTHSTENHIRGIHPLHYMGDIYEYFKQALDVLNKYSYVNSVDNLYKEKSLKNKIETRAVNSSMMYGMRGQIQEIKKRLEEIRMNEN